MKEKQILLMKTQAHVAENGAPPDKFGLLQRLLSIESQRFGSRIDVSWLSQFSYWN